MTTKRKKGSSYTPPANERHWAQRARDAKRAAPPDRRQGRAGERPTAFRAGERSVSGRGDDAKKAPRRQSRQPANSRELVAGRNSVVEALRSHVPGTVLYTAPGESDVRVREARELAAKAGMTILETGRLELDRLTDGAVHQGIALELAGYSYAHPDDLLEQALAAQTPALVVALDGVTDPRNLGAIARSAGAFGAHGLLVPERRSAGVTAAAWKSSAGALARVPVARATNLSRTLLAYQQAGMFVVGLDAEGATDVDDLDLAPEPLVLVIGAEGRGLSRLVAERCDVVASIAPAAGTESLNASVAAGIALHEIARRRAVR